MGKLVLRRGDKEERRQLLKTFACGRMSGRSGGHQIFQLTLGKGRGESCCNHFNEKTIGQQSAHTREVFLVVDLDNSRGGQQIGAEGPFRKRSLPGRPSSRKEKEGSAPTLEALGLFLEVNRDDR